ncbi:hypothetical protein K461DRAFT_274244 [Myriangium duriaei CBS 260.36]|uniref:Uncharacterized protein n=1 Tax=Myriangium duriaei CBS 260.36 TaxID=1168546 RepID=A0A9P4JCC5_9PEZI|nr:hypothetical protein K461DRAFT_274244 [Myriangium duriaei CBS 260.36]
MANFYFAYVVPVRDRYITWALHNMVRGTQYSRPVKPSTSTEKQRVSGALYRFQLGCNVFCRPYANAKSFLFSKDEIHDLLLQNFHPWDIEAVNCIYLYMDRFFDHVLDLAVDRVDPRQAMDYPWDRLVDPCSHTYLCADECFCSPAARENILPQISCSGLPFVSRVTSLVDDRHPDLVHVVHDYLTEWRTKFFSAQGYTGGVCGLLTSITEPIPQNKRLALRSASPFIGDVMDGPPYAWVTLWRDTYSDMAGIYTPYKLKNWGYVMWDAIRVFNEGGISLLKRQWDERCVNEPYDGAEFFGSTSESS